MNQVEAQPLVELDARLIRVLFEGHEIAESRMALVLREPGKPPVWYFPRADVEMSVLGQTNKITISPTKGAATYFTILRDWHIVENALWSFEAPPPELAAIAGHIAFAGRHFEFESEGHSPDEWDIVLGGPD
jgi:uncharacterized protein (DUF427 family)